MDDHRLDITIHQGHQPELDDADARVVVDVIRAFTNTHVALAGGARRVLLAGRLEEARRLAAESAGRLLAGERNAIAPPDFDLGNSPAETDATDLNDCELVLTTSNGVQATLHARHDGPVAVTGFTNAGRTVDYLRELVDIGAHRIQLIASHPDGDEDLACAEWIRARLHGESTPTDERVIERIRNCRAAQKFLDPNRPAYRSADIDYCARRCDTTWAMLIDSTGDVPTVVRQ